MVSDQEIASCVESLLRSAAAGGGGAAAGGGGAGAGEASFTAVVQQAEAKLGVDLSHKASFIRDQMDLFFGPRLQSPPPKIPTAPASAPGPAALTPQPVPQQMAQLSTLQPHLIFQTVQQLPATAVSAPPAVPAMAFYPPPPLAFRYSTAMGGANAGAISFQQPATGTVATTTASATTAAQAGSDTKESSSKRKRGGPGGLNKVCGISPELQTIVGETVMSRTQIVKQLWAYIRKNNLQDPDDKRKIICNDELRVVFGTDTTDMFKMNKLLAKHITPIDPKDQIREVKKVKAPSVVPQPRPHVSQSSVVISDALAKFIGTEGTVLQDDALKYLWDYIKANQLEASQDLERNNHY